MNQSIVYGSITYYIIYTYELFYFILKNCDEPQCSSYELIVLLIMDLFWVFIM